MQVLGTLSDSEMSRYLHASGAVVSSSPGYVDAAGIELLEVPHLVPSSGQASTCMSSLPLAWQHQRR